MELSASPAGHSISVEKGQATTRWLWRTARGALPRGTAASATGSAFFATNGNTTDVAIRLGSGSVFTWNGSTGNATTLSGEISGAGAITKVSGETLRLTGVNTYTGGTTTTIGVDGTLAGGGSIGGTTTIQGTHNPGFSPGIQTFTNGLSYADTAKLAWDLIDNTTTGRGTNYDAVNVSGGGFALATGATIDLSFGGTVDFLNTFWGFDQEWLVVDLSGSATGPWDDIRHWLVLAPHPDDFEVVAVSLRHFARSGADSTLEVLSARASGVEDAFATGWEAKIAAREAELRESCAMFGLPTGKLRFRHERNLRSR